MKLRNNIIYTSILILHAVQAGFRHAPSGFGDFSYNCPIGISLHAIFIGILIWSFWSKSRAGVSVTLSLTVP